MSKIYERKMAEAEDYDDWRDAAIAYDERNGLDRWKQSRKSHLFDHAAIRSRLERLQILRQANDNHGLLFTLNEGIHGNMGGMGSESLYKRAKFGTKQLIVDYVEEVTASLEHLAKPRVKGVTMQEKIDFFHRAQLCFGQSALMFSGSGTYLFYHVGVLKTLWEQDLIPDVISGASGGALIVAVAGTRSPQNLSEIFESDFLDFEEEIATIISNISPRKKRHTRVEDLRAVIERLIPDLTFEEAYQLSGLKINISIAPAETHQKSRLLNAITSPNVLIREAVLASCCIPGVFSPVTLAAKNVKGERVPYLPSRRWVDGSISDDLPMKRLARLYGVNHFIVSQTNPLILPFLSTEKRGNGVVTTIGQTALNTMKDWGLAASYLIQKPLKADSYFSKLLNAYISVVSQSYTGDINILPSSRFVNPAKIMASRSPEEVLSLMNEGQRSTWPVVERIRIQTHISRTLTEIVTRLDNHASGTKTPIRSREPNNLKKLELVPKKQA